MRLRQQFSLWLLFIAVCVGLMSVAWVQRAHRIKAQFDAFANLTTPGLVALGQIKASALAQLQWAEVFASAEGDARVRREADEAVARERARYLEWTGVYRGIARAPEEHETLDTVERAGAALSARSVEFMAQAGQGQDLAEVHEELRKIERRFARVVDRAIGWHLEDAQAQKTALTQDLDRAARLSLASGAILALLAVGLGVFMAGRIARPLGRLADDMRVVGQGALDRRTAVRSRDEIGQVAATFNRMAEDLQQTTVSKHYVDRIITSMADTLVATDLEGRIQTVNASAERVLGRRAAELVNRPLSSLFAPGATAPSVSDLLTQGTVRNLETAYTASDGRAVPVLFSAAVMPDAQGRPAGVVCVASDITERTKAQEALRRAQDQLAQSEKLAALGRFAAGVAHEVKNPLAIIQGGVEFLALKVGGQDQDLRETMQMIEESVQRADTIVRDLLKFARPSTQKREVVAPEELVQGTLSLLTYGRALKTISVETRFAQDGLRVAVDKNQIQQVLLNLMMNALDAMGEQGRLTVSTAPASLPGEQLGCAIAVADTGSGIAPEHRDKLFEPFFTTKRDKKGTGLGLSISKTIAESHGGTLTLESELGKGTVVTLVLPLQGGPG